MLFVEISELDLLPGDDESPSGDNESPFACDETPSVEEGRKQDAIASSSEGIGGNTGTGGSSGILGVVCNTGIRGSCGMLCGVLGVSVEKIGSMLSASIYFSRLELTRDDHISASYLPSE